MDKSYPESSSPSQFSEGVVVSVKSLDYTFPPPEPTLPDTCLLFEELYRDIIENSKSQFPNIKKSFEDKRSLDIIYHMNNNQEYTTRGLIPSEYILIINPAHYSVWVFRERILDSIQFSIEDEMSLTRKISYYNLKTFQVWNHRRWLVIKGYDSYDEIRYTRLEIMVDTKNYILWSYRQWLISNYFIDDNNILQEELSLTSLVLENDPLNNSIWVYRMFLIQIIKPDLSIELDFSLKFLGVDSVVSDYIDEIKRMKLLIE